MWDKDRGMYMDMDFNGTLLNIKGIGSLYPLMVQQVRPDRIQALVDELASNDFNTTALAPTVATDTEGFSPDLSRGGMWHFQNWYLIRGLSTHGYKQQADYVAERTVAVSRKYSETFGVVFEYYDSLDQQLPTILLRDNERTGGIRDYNFCGGLTNYWMRGFR